MGRRLALIAVMACLLLVRILPRAPAEQEPSPAPDQGSAAQPADRDNTGAAAAQAPDTDTETLDPLGPNAACYVCHMTFVDEELATTHLEEDITCIDCHGASQGHANDEDIGATPPDIVIKGPQINKSCRKCHEQHDVAPEDVVARWLKRNKSEPAAAAKPAAAAETAAPSAPAKPANASAAAKPANASAPAQPPLIVCTDCHGHHRVAKAL